ncbi:MAG: cation:proton antiporter subunit C [Bacillota bacterium]
MNLWRAVLSNYPYLVSLVLFGIGIATVLTRSNLMKKIIGINIMESGVFLFFIALGNIRGSRAPIIELGTEAVLYANPIPSALILTGIVVSVSVTAFALGLVVKLYKFYGTIEPEEIIEIKSTGR